MRIKKPIPFEFVLDALSSIEVFTRPMFGCTAVYRGEEIVLVMRSKENHTRDNGVWLATTADRHEALRPDFPMLRSIELLGDGPTGWQNIPADSPDFEAAVLRACRLIVKGDPRIGKIPKPKKKLMKTKRKRASS